MEKPGRMRFGGTHTQPTSKSPILTKKTQPTSSFSTTTTPKTKEKYDSVPNPINNNKNSPISYPQTTNLKEKNHIYNSNNVCSNKKLKKEQSGSSTTLIQKKGSYGYFNNKTKTSQTKIDS